MQTAREVSASSAVREVLANSALHRPGKTPHPIGKHARRRDARFPVPLLARVPQMSSIAIKKPHRRIENFIHDSRGEFPAVFLWYRTFNSKKPRWEIIKFFH